jgi:hypothetical protein
MSRPEPLLHSQYYHIYNRGNNGETLFRTPIKAFNRAYQRTGSLFGKPFRRILVDSDHYFAHLIVYIHRNPQKYGFVDDSRNRPYSSYRATLSAKPTRIQREAVLDWFDSQAGFETSHSSSINESVIEPLIADDFM